jgi:pimeloyl-ACP methyl ester carboxylesterase
MSDIAGPDGWELRESGPVGASHSALLLPGALASATFYDELVAEPSLRDVRLVATTLPGYAGTPPPADDAIETYARQAGELARAIGADVVVGHSLGANVAIEMAGAQTFAGSLVLLSPSFSRKDESIVPRVLDRLATALGPLPFALALKGIGGMLKGNVPEARLPVLAGELRKNDPRFVRRNTRTVMRYYDHHGTLVPRLRDSERRAWVVFGEHDDIKLQDSERRELDACPQIDLVTIPDTGHFALNTHPAVVAELILAAIAHR